MTKQDNTPRRTGAQEQFGRQAQHYTRSAGHSSGESLQVVRDWASSARYARAVDVATGTGFTAFTIAPFADSVVASDLTPEMIAETRKLASERGVTNVVCALAAAEDLPFADASLDLLTCRIAPHHFMDLRKAITEWRPRARSGRHPHPRGYLLAGGCSNLHLDERRGGAPRPQPR